MPSTGSRDGDWRARPPSPKQRDYLVHHKLPIPSSQGQANDIIYKHYLTTPAGREKQRAQEQRQMTREEELAKKARALIEEAAQVPPVERFNEMVKSGLIDAEGHLLRTEDGVDPESELGGTPLIFAVDGGSELTFEAMKDDGSGDLERCVVISDLSKRVVFTAYREDMQRLHEFTANWLSSEGDGGFEEKLVCPVCRSVVIYERGLVGHECGHCGTLFNIQSQP